jgi:hypothetical protein
VTLSALCRCAADTADRGHSCSPATARGTGDRGPGTGDRGPGTLRCQNGFCKNYKKMALVNMKSVVTIYTAHWSLYVPHIGHYMYRTVVTVCTAQWSLYVPHNGHYMYHQFNIQQSHVLHHTAVFMCFVWISEQTAIISLYSIN